MIKDIFNLAILNAFTMDPADISYSLKRRLPGKRLALLNWGPGQIKVGFATKSEDGLEVAPEQLMFEADTPIEKIATALKDRTDCSCVAVLYNAVNLFCEAQTDLKKSPSSEEVAQKLYSHSAEIIGDGFEKEKIYQILYAPDRQSRLVFSTSVEPYLELEKQLKAAGLTIIRAQMGAYAMLNAMLADDLWKGAESPTEIMVPTIINQVHAIVVGYDGENFSTDVFRASPLFWESSDKMDNPEFVEQIRSFFLNCAENVILAKKVIGKRVVFKVLSSQTSPEAANNISSYLDDRVEVGFETFNAEPNLEFKALIQG